MPDMGTMQTHTPLPFTPLHRHLQQWTRMDQDTLEVIAFAPSHDPYPVFPCLLCPLPTCPLPCLLAYTGGTGRQLATDQSRSLPHCLR